jgi:hypothetical protein
VKIRYFVVGQYGQLGKVSRSAVRELWERHRRADALGSLVSHELRLVSVLCDDDLLPQRVYVLRLPLLGGRFTQESYLTLRLFSRPDCVTPQEAFEHHAQGWPADLLRQLAVALDVPVAALEVPFGIGGPHSPPPPCVSLPSRPSATCVDPCGRIRAVGKSSDR